MSSRPTPEQLKTWGASLREIDPSSLVQEEGLKVRWYLGDNATELYCWVHHDGAPDHMQLVFSRTSVEWSVRKGLVTTGTFQSGASMAGGRYDPYLLSVGREVDLDVCEAGIALLLASSVDPALVAPMVEALSGLLKKP